MSAIDPEKSGYVRFFFRHPVLCLYRLMRIANQNDRNRQILLLRNLASGLPDRVAADYMAEIENLKGFAASEYPVFPYPMATDEPFEVESGLDRKKGLPYVVHKGRRFYGRKDQSVGEVLHWYRYFVGEEGILGTGRRTKSPHSYVDADFKVESGDVVVDLGCSDALFAFDNAEQAGRIYLFESWKRWKPALEASFEPWKEKTRIIAKTVSGSTNKRETRLADALQEPSGSRYFIKMDIEGGERDVISSSADFLRANKVKLSCCVYHRQDDAEVISAQLKTLGFRTRYSEGYMLPLQNEMLSPYFRHGVIYARNY